MCAKHNARTCIKYCLDTQWICLNISDWKRTKKALLVVTKPGLSWWKAVGGGGDENCKNKQSIKRCVLLEFLLLFHSLYSPPPPQDCPVVVCVRFGSCATQKSLATCQGPNSPLWGGGGKSKTMICYGLIVKRISSYPPWQLRCAISLLLHVTVLNCPQLCPRLSGPSSTSNSFLPWIWSVFSFFWVILGYFGLNLTRYKRQTHLIWTNTKTLSQ